MLLLSKRTLKEKFENRATKRRIRETRDAIIKLKGRPDPVVVNGFPTNPVQHQIVRDNVGLFWVRNAAHTGWVKLGGSTSIELGETFEEFITNNFGTPIPVVEALPPIPTETGFAKLVWFENQLWGAEPGSDRWYPAMRFTTTDGTP